MTLLGLLVLILIAGACGLLGQMLAGYSFGGLVITVLIGFVGAWVGWWIAREFELPTFITIEVDGRTFPIIWSVIGSALVAAIASLLSRPRGFV